MGDDSSGEQCMGNIPTMVQGAGYKVYTTKQKPLEEAPSAPRPTEQPDSSTWELMVPQGTVSFWERTETPLPLPKLSPKQLSPFPERSELPFPSE